MGVQTTADERLEDAANCIHKALKALSEIVMDECWGYDEFSRQAENEMWAAFMKLQEIHSMPVFKTYRGRTGRSCGT